LEGGFMKKMLPMFWGFISLWDRHYRSKVVIKDDMELGRNMASFEV
jgi:hypothetical protein